jgi:hypothetical protein
VSLQCFGQAAVSPLSKTTTTIVRRVMQLRGYEVKCRNELNYI